MDGARFLRGDALDQSTVDALSTALGGRGADVLLSDMAPNASGHKSTDHLRQMELCFMALSLCEALLRQKTGSMVIKMFAGAEEAAFINAVRAAFSSVKRVKPDASRKESREFFLVAQGYHGRGPSAGDDSPSPSDEES